MKRLLLTFFFCHVVALTFLLHWVGYRVNFTDSMPHGLYQVVPGKPAKGDLVTFSLSENNPYFKISLERKYLGQHQNAPLLKVLAGTAGDDIKISSLGVSVNDMLLPRSKQQIADCYGRNLPTLLHSTIIPSAKGLTMSTYTESSFDGRYFGLVDIDIMQRVIPVFTFSLEDRSITEYSCPMCGSQLTHLLPTKEKDSRWICNGYPTCHYWTHTPDKRTNVAEAKE